MHTYLRKNTARNDKLKFMTVAALRGGRGSGIQEEYLFPGSWAIGVPRNPRTSLCS